MLEAFFILVLLQIAILSYIQQPNILKYYHKKALAYDHGFLYFNVRLYYLPTNF